MRKLGQIWIETVLYTLIGLILIGLVLAFATPVIKEQKDKSLFKASVDAMNNLDVEISNVKRGGDSNIREVEVFIRKGRLIINAEQGPDLKDNAIIFEIDDSSYAASEVSTGEVDRIVDISGTNLKVVTKEEKKGKYKIIIYKAYNIDEIDLTYKRAVGEEGNVEKTFDQASTPYRIMVENWGDLLPGEPTSALVINFYDIS